MGPARKVYRTCGQLETQCSGTPEWPPASDYRQSPQFRAAWLKVPGDRAERCQNKPAAAPPGSLHADFAWQGVATMLVF